VAETAVAGSVKDGKSDSFEIIFRRALGALSK